MDGAMRQIVLLRGVNIGARNRIAMPKLRETLQAAGFADVATYLQSGNVVLTSDASPACSPSPTKPVEGSDSGACERQVMHRTRRGGEHLVHRDLAAVEGPRRTCHVKAPDPLPLLTCFNDRRLAPGREIGEPAAERQRVVLAKRLDVAHLETRQLERPHRR